jgi:hypothetical protein
MLVSVVRDAGMAENDAVVVEGWFGRLERALRWL